MSTQLAMTTINALMMLAILNSVAQISLSLIALTEILVPTILAILSRDASSFLGSVIFPETLLADSPYATKPLEIVHSTLLRAELFSLLESLSEDLSELLL